MSWKRHFIWGVVAMGAGLVSACKKERDEVSREGLAEVGYEVTQDGFFRAAASDDVTAMVAMLEAGLEAGVRDGGGRTALHAAAGAGAEVAMDFLLDEGIGIDERDGAGRTPLMEAVVVGPPAAVRYLLRQGADPLLRDAGGYKPLMLAVTEGRAEMVPELAPYARGDLDDALLAAAILGRTGVIDQLTNFGASVYARLEDGRTALMLAAQKGHGEAAELLVEIGANRFGTDEQGRMAADLARESGHEELAAWLAAPPEEEDFELSEPAGVGAALVAEVEGARSGDGVLGSAGAVLLDGAMLGLVGGEVLSPSPAGPAERCFRGGEAGAARPSTARLRAHGLRLPPQEAGLVMRAYRQRELPVRLKSVEGAHAEFRVGERERVVVAEGEILTGTELRVIRVRKRMESGKESKGRPREVSVVEIEGGGGVRREWVTGLPATAHDPVALVEDQVDGVYYVAVTGARFRARDGREFVVADVRPNQVVVADVVSGEARTIRLIGPRG